MGLLFCSACLQLFKKKANSKDARKSTFMIFQRVGVVVVGVGSRENERVGLGWVYNINVQKG